MADDKQKSTATSGGEQTPVEESARRTGSNAKTDAKPTAKPESGEGSNGVEGAPNQGTETR
jgi:photosystem I subunit IV